MRSSWIAHDSRWPLIVGHWPMEWGGKGGQEADRDPPASVAEREVASAIGPRKARPFARSTVVWVRGGRVAEGSRSVACYSKMPTKKGRYAPFMNTAVRFAECNLIRGQWEERDRRHVARVLYQSALMAV